MDWKCKRGPQIPRVVIVVLAGAVFASGAPEKSILKEYDNQIRKESSVLDSIKAELERGRERIEELKKKEGAYLGQLNQLEQNMQTAQDLIAQLSSRIDTVNASVELLGDSLQRATDALAFRQKKMAARLRNMYKTGNVGWAQIFLASGSISDMLNRAKYFQELKAYDNRLANAIDSTRTQIAGHKTNLEEQREKLIALRAVKESEQNTLVAEQQDKKNMLETVKQEREAHVQMVEELERAQKQLTLIVKGLEKKKDRVKQDLQRAAKVAFAKRKGKLPWPVSGSLSKKFGKMVHPVYKTVTMSVGIDINAEKGTNVYSVAPGRIDYVGWMRGYGKFLIVNHYDEYVTIYAHMDIIQVEVDQEVKYGTPLGRVGDTGSLTGSKLHFEIRKASSPLNPEEWLEKLD